MTDPHEEQHLDLPEINKRKIEDNRWDIINNRMMIITIGILLVVMVIGSHIITNHTMEDCEDRLFEKLTNQKIDRDLFVEVKDGRTESKR